LHEDAPFELQLWLSLVVEDVLLELVLRFVDVDVLDAEEDGLEQVHVVLRWS
jgi:hypothetical protein